MPINASVPDYELDDVLELSTPAEVKAISDPLRLTLLDLMRERAATVTELASAVSRPKSTVAHHVNVLVSAGLARVVRTRRVRAIEERFYGRTARTVHVGLGISHVAEDPSGELNDFVTGARESAAAHETGHARTFIRHARIPEERAAEFWRRVSEVVAELDEVPRSGDQVYGFVVGLYPTSDYPMLPAAESEE
jgi:DNA-binding transcriptional ArsR family regulator